MKIQDLDEALFAIGGVLNYTAEVTEEGGEDRLHLCFHVIEGEEQRVLKKVEETLHKTQSIRHILDQKALYVASITFSSHDWFTTGVRKRRIVDKRSSMVLNGS